MARLTAEDLRRETLRRQFPDVTGAGPGDVLDLLDRLGPLQSQVPRAPFVALAARLPGVAYAAVRDLFSTHRLLRATNLRGTVHTSTRTRFAQLDVVATTARRPAVRNVLRLARVTPEEVDAEVRRFAADGWRGRAELVAHLRGWLAEQESPAAAERLAGTYAESLVWGSSGLLRRPRTGAWERRTESLHRTAAAEVAELDPSGMDARDALAGLVRVHLGAYGPLTRRDLSFFFGVGLTAVDAALSALGDEVRPLAGPDGVAHLDLAEPPVGGQTDPGLRLLPEFDGLLLGYAGPARTRFLDERSLAEVWAKVNGVFSPVVLHDGRLVARWRTVPVRGGTALEVTMLGPGRPLAPDLFSGPAADLGRALDLTVTDVQVVPAGTGPQPPGPDPDRHPDASAPLG